MDIWKKVFVCFNRKTEEYPERLANGGRLVGRKKILVGKDVAVWECKFAGGKRWRVVVVRINR